MANMTLRWAAAPFWRRIGRAPGVYLPRRSGRLFLMNKFFQWFVAVFVVVCGDSASQAVQIDANFAGRIIVRDIDNGVITGASNATQLAFGPGPDPDLLYLYMSSNHRGVRRAVYDPVTGLSGLTTILPNIRGNGIAFRTNASGQHEMYLSEPYSKAPRTTPLGFRDCGKLWIATETEILPMPGRKRRRLCEEFRATITDSIRSRSSVIHFTSATECVHVTGIFRRFPRRYVRRVGLWRNDSED